MKDNDQYQFNLFRFNVPPVEYGAITSIKFSPNSESQIILGFLSSSPSFYSFLDDGVFFTNFTDIQPSPNNNAKVARYLPDGIRVYSYDFEKGVGLWSGPKNKLYYQSKFFLYGAASNMNGSQLIGYQWQTIRLVNITLQCANNISSIICPC